MKFTAREETSVEADQFTSDMAHQARLAGVAPGPFGLKLVATPGYHYVSCPVPSSADIEGYTFAMVSDWIIRVGVDDYLVMSDLDFRNKYIVR